MTRTLTTPDGNPAPRRVAWRGRGFVLGGLALAVVYTAAAFGFAAGAEYIGPFWMAAIAWAVTASLVGALWRGFRHGDWSAFSAYELPPDDDDLHEWTLRTGRYSSLREMEDQLLHDHDHLR